MLFQREDTTLILTRKLADAFQTVTSIGEIDLTESDYKILKNSVHDTWQTATLSPEVVAAVLVFCARYVEYGEDERIQFWEKFSQTVLKRDLNQQIGNDWRDKFKIARDKLREKYGFVFPTRKILTQHIIGGIYNHAILPAYLADEFIEWFLKEYPTVEAWTRLKEHYPDEIAEHHLKEIEVKQPHIRLKRFLSEEETRLTAAKLVRNLATAAWWYVQGEFEGDDITSLLSPIERSLWTRLSSRLDMLHLKPQAVSRESRVRQRWSWLIEQNTILELHVKNLQITGRTPPDRLVWLPKDSEIRAGETVPHYGSHFCEVNAWDVGKGYVIDNATLIDIREIGWIVPVDIDDRALCQPIETIALPQVVDKAVMLFRVQPETSFAILSDWDRLTSGDYAISHGEGFSIKALEGGEVIRNYKLPVPDVLREQGHTEAAHYTLRLPVEINGERINPQRSRVAPVIHGQHPIAGLLPSAVPMYAHGDVWLSFTAPKGVPLSKLSLELVVNDAVKIHRLSELEAAGHIARREEHGQFDLTLNLTPYIAFPSLIQATIYNGLNPMHGEPRIAGVLSQGVNVEPDDTTLYYTTAKRPDVCITGVGSAQIEFASYAEPTPIDEQSIIITWQDPRQDAAIRLVFGDLKLPLTFDFKWSHGWIEPLKAETELSESRLDEAQLHVRGKPKSSFYIEVEGVGRSSAYTLNSLGVMDAEIRYDRLKDVLLGYQGAQTTVHLVFADQPTHKIALCEFIRPAYQPEPVTPPVSVIEPSPARSTSLPPLHKPTPPVTIPVAPPTPKRFDQLRQHPFPSIAEFVSKMEPAQRRLFPPETQWLLVGETTYEIRTDVEGRHIFLPRPNTEGVSDARVGVEERGATVHLRPTNDLLMQCKTCGHLYWEDDRGAKIKHAHGMPLPRGHRLSKQAVEGRISAFNQHFTNIRNYSFDFTPFISREMRLLPRQATTPTVSRRPYDKPAVLSKKGYETAVSEWISTTTTETHAAIKTLCEMESRLQKLTTIWQQSANPALIWASQWVKQELRARQHKNHDDAALIPNLMVLAVIARDNLHHQTPILRDEADKQLVETALDIAYTYFHPLLIWAAAWAEFNFMYWKDKTR